jgi:hypothetical protein
LDAVAELVPPPGVLGELTVLVKGVELMAGVGVVGKSLDGVVRGVPTADDGSSCPVGVDGVFTGDAYMLYNYRGMQS